MLEKAQLVLVQGKRATTVDLIKRVHALVVHGIQTAEGEFEGAFQGTEYSYKTAQARAERAQWLHYFVLRKVFLVLRQRFKENVRALP